MELTTAAPLLTSRPQVVLAVPRPDGAPHVTRVVQHFDGQVVRISLTDGRVKTGLLRQAGVASVMVPTESVWEWVTVEGRAVLSDVAAAPDDAVVDELLSVYEAISGAHPDPDEFRAAMVAEGRLVLRVTPTRVYGQLPG